MSNLLEAGLFSQDIDFDRFDDDVRSYQLSTLLKMHNVLFCYVNQIYNETIDNARC
jgi:hypothetical protein